MNRTLLWIWIYNALVFAEYVDVAGSGEYPQGWDPYRESCSIGSPARRRAIAAPVWEWPEARIGLADFFGFDPAQLPANVLDIAEKGTNQ